jgi:hypothetical protein
VRLEITAAVDNGVKLIAVQETDIRHGSVQIAEHQNDCPDNAKQQLFASKHKAILWIRATHFRQVATRQIVQRMLVADDVDVPQLMLHGDLSTHGT